MLSFQIATHYARGQHCPAGYTGVSIVSIEFYDGSEARQTIAMDIE